MSVREFGRRTRMIGPCRYHLDHLARRCPVASGSKTKLERLRVTSLGTERHLYNVGTSKKGHRVGSSGNRHHVVLIVEDEVLIRMDACGMIRDAGFDVVEAANADEAVAILETRLDITVVFTDVQMPGSMDGLKLAAAIRHRWPPIKIIATSGNVKAGLQDLPEGGQFLQKPYTLGQIINAITSLAA